MSEQEKTGSYLENYAVLQETAKTLREQKEPDLDTLIPMVDKALSAYKSCRERIGAVRSMLDERLGENAIDIGEPDSE